MYFEIMCFDWDVERWSMAVTERESQISGNLLSVLTGGRTKSEVREALWGYLFLAPWMIGLIMFLAGPIVASLFFSFTEYDVLSPPSWVGLENYQRAFFRDGLFWSSLGRTFYYAVVSVPLGLLGSLLSAILLNQDLPGTNLFRTIFYLPSLIPAAAMALLWRWLLNPRLGPINHYFSQWFGWPSDFPWLTHPDTVIPTLIVMALWASWGSNTMLIFLAALQGVPEALYDAAEIDGAGVVARFRHVTLPMISPAFFFNLVLGVIGALQVFTVTWVATQGGPSYGSWFFALHIYQQAFRYFRMGYGAALSWIFVVIVMTLTLINVRFSEEWVYYGGA